jgi:hypothetical protein
MSLFDTNLIEKKAKVRLSFFPMSVIRIVDQILQSGFAGGPNLHGRRPAKVEMLRQGKSYIKHIDPASFAPFYR